MTPAAKNDRATQNVILILSFILGISLSIWILVWLRQWPEYGGIPSNVIEEQWEANP